MIAFPQYKEETKLIYGIILHARLELEAQLWSQLLDHNLQALRAATDHQITCFNRHVL